MGLSNCRCVFQYVVNENPYIYQQIDVQRPNGEAAKRVRVKAWKVGKDEEQNGPTNEKGQLRFMFTNNSSERMTFKV